MIEETFSMSDDFFQGLYLVRFFKKSIFQFLHFRKVNTLDFIEKKFMVIRQIFSKLQAYS